MQDEGKRFRIITLALVGAFVALWLFFVPSWGDDIIYRHIPDTATSNIESDYWDQTGEHVTTLGDAFEGAYLHYRYINGRLINTIPFFMSILPGWIWPLLNGIAAAGMLYLIGLAASRLVPGEITSWLFALAALLLWKWLPWYDAMSCQVYFINYVWTCAAAVGFLILYMKGSKGNRPALILGALLAFFVGSAHEEYALCAIGGVIFWHLAARRLPHGYQWCGSSHCCWPPSSASSPPRRLVAWGARPSPGRRSMSTSCS